MAECGLSYLLAKCLNGANRQCPVSLPMKVKKLLKQKQNLQESNRKPPLKNNSFFKQGAIMLFSKASTVFYVEMCFPGDHILDLKKQKTA